MSRLSALAVAMAAAVPSIAAAQAVTAAEPSAPVPAPAYRSVFQALPTGVEEEQLDWRKANADVGQFPRGHADYVKWEERQQGAGTAGPGATAVPGPAPAPAPQPQGAHQHH